jgi:integron integrase
LGKEIGDLGELVRARRRRKLPVVLSQDEVKRILERLEGTERLFLTLLYGKGLRLTEGLRLRVKDLDFAFDQITVRDGKGEKDRVTMLPVTLKRDLRSHLEQVKALHTADLARGWGQVDLPYALARKYPSAATEWGWQYVFPSPVRSQDPRTGQWCRHHLYETTIQKAFRRAVRQTGIAKPASCHSLRHSLATHLLQEGVDIRQVQLLLRHRSIATTELYLHADVDRLGSVLIRRSPLERGRRKKVIPLRPALEQLLGELRGLVR